MIQVEKKGELYVADMPSHYSNDVSWMVWVDCPLKAVHKILLMDMNSKKELDLEDSFTR